MNQAIPAITDRELRFALVGCGRISANHVDAIQRLGSAGRLVAVCDVDARRAEAVSEATGARPFSRLSRMLAGCDADAVIVATPSGLHAAQAMEAAAAGRHVITEKPMATRWADGRRMIEACDAAGVRLLVVKQNRHNAGLQLLRNAIRARRFGRIHMVSLNVFWHRPQAYYDSAAWRGTWEYDGGALMNQASHYVDLVDWLIGPVESLHAYTATLGRDIEVEDTAVLNLRWRNGALGSLNVTMLAYPGNFEGSITVLGEKGRVRIGGVAVNEIQEWHFAESAEDDDRVGGASCRDGSVYGTGHIGYYENAVKALRGETEPETDGRQGLKSLEILTAAYRSARSGTRIALPLEH